MTDLHSVSVFVVDGFPSHGHQGELLGGGGLEGGGHFRLGAEQHFRLETCLPEIRDQLAEDGEGGDTPPDTGYSQHSSHPRPRPPPPPKPANISAKLLELRRLAAAESAQLKYETRSYNSAAVRGGDSNNNTTTVNSNSSSSHVVSLAIRSGAEAAEADSLLVRGAASVRSAAPGSRIPTLAASPRPGPAPAPGSPAHKCDNHLNHKVYLTIEPGKVATKGRRPSQGGDPRPGTPHQARPGPASLIPRPRAATPQQLSGRATPSPGHLGSCTASLSGRATPTSSSSARATPTPRPRPPSRRGSQLSLGPRSLSGSRIPVSTARHSSLDTAEVDSGVWITRYLHRHDDKKISG